MAKAKTPMEKHADRMALAALTIAMSEQDREVLQSAAAIDAEVSIRGTLAARAATREARAMDKWDEAVAEAASFMALPEQAKATLLAYETEKAKATGKGETQGKIEAAAEAGLLPEAPKSKRRSKRTKGSKVIDTTGTMLLAAPAPASTDGN